MLVLMSCIICVIFLVVLAFRRTENDKSVDGLCAIAAAIVICGGIFLSFPGHGVEIIDVKETELIPIEDIGSDKNVYYLFELDSDEFMYAYNKTSKKNGYNLNGKKYCEDIKKAKVYESKTCDKPVVKKIIQRGKRGLFFYGWMADGETYEFYVPEGSVRYKK